MSKIREAVRLRSEGFSARQIAKSLSLGRATISDYIRRADVEGLTWPLPNALSDADLERLLFHRTAGDLRGVFPQPDWSYIHTAHV
jgi:DNA-binding transcriptional regulator LsrR (DeoR family)